MDITTHLKKSEPDPVLRATPVLALFRKIRFFFAPSPSPSVFCVLNSMFCVLISVFFVSSCLSGGTNHAL
jgi:hypothetical protein